MLVDRMQELISQCYESIELENCSSCDVCPLYKEMLEIAEKLNVEDFDQLEDYEVSLHRP